MTPYRHFPSKAALLAAVASHGFEMLGRLLVAADDHPDAGEALVAQGVAFVEFAAANPALFRVMYSHEYGSADTAVVRKTFETLANRVASLIPEHASAATLACRSLVQGMATILLNGRLGPSQPEDIAVGIRLLVQGLQRTRSA